MPATVWCSVFHEWNILKPRLVSCSDSESKFWSLDTQPHYPAGSSSCQMPLITPKNPCNFCDHGTITAEARLWSPFLFVTTVSQPGSSDPCLLSIYFPSLTTPSKTSLSAPHSCQPHLPRNAEREKCGENTHVWVRSTHSCAHKRRRRKDQYDGTFHGVNISSYLFVLIIRALLAYCYMCFSIFLFFFFRWQKYQNKQQFSLLWHN